MWSKIFCFTFFVYSISQTIAAPSLGQDSEEKFHFDEINENFFGEQECLRRNLSSFTSVGVLNRLLQQIFSSEDYQLRPNWVNEKEKIESNFTEIINIVNNADESQLEQILPKSMNNTGNKIAYILISNLGKNLKAKVNKVDEMSKQLSAALQARNPTLGKRLMEEFNNKVIMAAILKKDSSFFNLIADGMKDIMHEVNRFETQLYNDVTQKISTVRTEVVEDVQYNNNSEWSQSTTDLMDALSKQLRRIIILKDPSKRSKLGQCLVEDAMIEIFNNGRKVFFA